VHRYHGWLTPLLVGLGAMFLLQMMLSAVQELALLRIELKLALEQSAQFTWHVLRLPIEFFSQRYTGDLANRIDANDRVARLLARDCGRAAAACFTAAFLAIVMMFYNETLAAIAIGGAAINIVALSLVNRALQDVTLRLQTEVGKLYAVSVIGLQSIETLKSTGREGDFFAKWTGHHARALNSEQKLAVYQQASNLVPPLVSSLTAAAVLGVGALQVIDSTLSVGELVAFQGLLMNFSAPIALMVGTAAKAQQASADLARLDDVLRYRRDWRFADAPPAPAEGFAAGHLSLKGTDFGYNPLEPPLVRDFSLEVSRPMGGAGRRLGQRQVDHRQADHRPLRAARGRGAHRWVHAARMGTRAAGSHRELGRPGHPSVPRHAARQRHSVGRDGDASHAARRDR
jgi:ABC-type bacteriocin/lantibiotic exporter with double-glycine peptidase domain